MLKVLVRDPETLKSVVSEDWEWFMKEYEVILTWIQENDGLLATTRVVVTNLAMNLSKTIGCLKI